MGCVCAVASIQRAGIKQDGEFTPPRWKKCSGIKFDIYFL